MSSGKKSPLFRPITSDLLPWIEETHLRARPHVRPIFEILTTDCYVETLLFVAVIDALDRALGGEPGTIMLSAVMKNGVGKAQTAAMELVHDVLVELPMAGRNYTRLQAYLKGIGFEWCMMHSCGGDCVPIDLVEAWYDARGGEQKLRTRLDWQGAMRKAAAGVDDAFVLASTLMEPGDLATINRIVRSAKMVLGLGGTELISAA